MSQSSPNFCTTETAWRDAMLVAHVSAADSWQMMLSESEDLGKKWVEHVMIPFDTLPGTNVSQATVSGIN